MNKRSAVLLCSIGLLAFLLFVVGCGKSGGGSSPEAAAQAFVAALQAGDYARAADMMAWDEIARRQNPDWDSFPSSQRALIIGKLKQQMQSTLQQLAARAKGAQVSNVSVSGNMAQATAGSLRITLIQSGGKWKVLAVQ